MLQDKVLEDILEKEEDLISYCQTLTNINPSDEDDAQDTIKNYLGDLELYELLQLANNRSIVISNDELAVLLILEINGGEFIELVPKTSNILKYFLEILNTTSDIEDLKSKIKEYSDNEELILSCFR